MVKEEGVFDELRYEAVESCVDAIEPEVIEASSEDEEDNGPFDSDLFMDEREEVASPGVLPLLDDDDDDDGDDDCLPSEVISGSVSDIDTERNRACLERVKVNVKKYAELYWDLARDIFEINSGKLYRIAGYKTFEDYVTTELEFSRRKALHYVKIYKYFSKTLKANLADQPELYEEFLEAVKRMGWTKAEKIARRRVLNSENARILLEAFTTPNERGNLPSVIQVEEIVEKQYNSMKEEDRVEADEKNDIQTVRMGFTLSKAEANPVNDAFDLARDFYKKSGRSSVTPSTLLSMICSDFAVSYVADRGGNADVSVFLNRVSDLLDLDITAQSRTDGRIVFNNRDL